MRKFRAINIDKLVKSQKILFSVIPAETGIRQYQQVLDAPGLPNAGAGLSSPA